MENKLDKLFGDKLENFSMQPPAQAWNKVAVAFPKKNKSVVWAWRVAATIALAGFIAWYGFKDTKESRPMEAAKEIPTEKRPVEIKVEENKAEEQTVKRETSPKQIAIKEIEKPAQTVPLARLETEKNIQEEPQPAEIVASVEEVKDNQELMEPAVQPKQEKTMVIVYSLASVDTRQDVEPAKTKGFKKVIEFAKEVKGGETTLATVRTWKDNFFGLEEQARVEKQNNY